jgi:hypothetical protein
VVLSHRFQSQLLLVDRIEQLEDRAKRVPKLKAAVAVMSTSRRCAADEHDAAGATARRA